MLVDQLVMSFGLYMGMWFLALCILIVCYLLG